MHDKTSAIINYAQKHVPYYRQIQSCSYQSLPYQEKHMIMADYSKFLSQEYIHYPFSQNLINCRTSGSTGQFLKVCWDANDIKYSLAELWLLRSKYYGITPKDAYCFFYTTEYQNNQILDEKSYYYTLDKRGLGFCKSNITQETIIQIYQQMLEFSPVWIMTQPSTALLFSFCIKQNSLPPLPSLRYIELAGELLFPEQKHEIEKSFSCQVANQYGCIEANSIAYECPHHNLHLMSSNVYAEIVDENFKTVPFDTEGEIIITSLHNHAMPFIKYRIGDRGTMSSSKCECGNQHPIITLTKGRCNDLIINSDGSILDAYLFVRSVEMINERIGEIIKQFRIIQKSYDSFEVHIVLDRAYKGWKDTVSKLFRDNLAHPQLVRANLSFCFCDYLLPSSTGKLAFFERTFDQELY